MSAQPSMTTRCLTFTEAESVEMMVRCLLNSDIVVMYNVSDKVIAVVIVVVAVELFSFNADVAKNYKFYKQIAAGFEPRTWMMTIDVLRPLLCTR